MMSIDRTTPPEWGDIKMPVIPTFEKTRLQNGLLMYTMKGGEQPVVKIDLVVQAGKLRCEKGMVASATLNLLNEGTTSMSSKEFAEKLEFYGAYMWGGATQRAANVSMICMQKDLRNVLDLVADAILHPQYPEMELEIYKQQKLQNLVINKMKTSYVATTEMSKAVYKEGLFTRTATEESIKALESGALHAFHDEAYRSTDAHLMVFGLPSDDDISYISETFGKQLVEGEKWQHPMPEYAERSDRRVDMESEQTSIVVARPLFGKQHPDYMKMSVLDTILGGYIGSRLMQNLREKLGLTYGITSHISSNSAYGTHIIRSDIKKGEHERALDEIRKEMKRLSEEIVTENELENVRNYMLGEVLRSFESPIASSDTRLELLVDDIDSNTYTKRCYDSIKDTTPEDLQALAKKWLNPDEYSTIVVGKL